METHIPTILKELLPPELVALCKSESFEKGEYLFHIGEKPQKMFYIVSGQAILSRPGIHGEITTLQRIFQGFISEASLLTDKYHCDAQFNQAGIAISIPVNAMKNALQDPLFSEKWTLLLSREIMRLRTYAERLSLKDIKSKIIHLIETEGKSGVYQLKSDVKSIASELAVTHEALYRALSTLQASGILQRKEDCLRLLKS